MSVSSTSNMTANHLITDAQVYAALNLIVRT